MFPIKNALRKHVFRKLRYNERFSKISKNKDKVK